MTRTSVLFKPGRKSKIAWDLNTLWYYEANYHKLKVNDPKIKKQLKITIDKVPYHKIWWLYDNINKYVNDEAVVIIMCSISNLFEDDV